MNVKELPAALAVTWSWRIAARADVETVSTSFAGGKS
jgi:hypothetical protein